MVIAMADSGHCKECQRQQHEYKRLDETDEQLQPVKYAGQEKRDQECHHHQYNFTGEDIAEETKREADDLGDLGDQLEKANHGPHSVLERILEVLGEIADTQGLDAEKLGHEDGDERQGQGHIQVGGGAAKQGHKDWSAFFCGRGDCNGISRGHCHLVAQFGLCVAVRPSAMVYANRAKAGQQANIVADQNKDEDGNHPREEFTAVGGAMAGDALGQIPHSFDQHLDNVLPGAGDFLHSGHGKDGHQDNDDVDQKGCQQAIGKPLWPVFQQRFGRQFHVGRAYAKPRQHAQNEQGNNANGHIAFTCVREE